jgi:N,N'-diacetyllegionaminate synthase
MTFIVAEIGINWDGSLELAKEMIFQAKKCGCDAVKFQAFTKETVKDHPEKDRLLKSSISSENIESIHQLAKNANIEWFCTPMYFDAVALIEPYVQKIKIRYSDGKILLENKSSKLIDAVLQTGKNIIISSEATPINSKFYSNPKIDWLYVVPKYPCIFEDINFTNLNDFNGYSNHCPDILAPITAVMLGSKIIEVHITSDKKKNFIDNPVSFDYNELENMVNQIRKLEKIKK